MVLTFCSSVFESFIFVAYLIVFGLPVVIFLVFASSCACVSPNFELRASFYLSKENLVLARALLGLDDVPVSLWISAFVGSGRFWGGFRLTFTSLSDQHCKSSLTSGGSGGYIRFF